MKNIIVKKEELCNKGQKESIWEFVGAVYESEFDNIKEYQNYVFVENLLNFPIEDRTRVYSKELSENLNAAPMFPCFECLYFRPTGKVAIVKKGEKAKFRGIDSKKWNVWSYAKSICSYNETGILVGNPKKCEPVQMNFKKYLTLSVNSKAIVEKQYPKSLNLMCIESFHNPQSKNVLWVYVKKNFI